LSTNESRNAFHGSWTAGAEGAALVTAAMRALSGLDQGSFYSGQTCDHKELEAATMATGSLGKEHGRRSAGLFALEQASYSNGVIDDKRCSELRLDPTEVRLNTFSVSS
jgi:hypothetical protein